MRKKLICFLFGFLLLAISSSAEIRQSETSDTWNQSISWILFFVALSACCVFLIIRIVQQKAEISGLKENMNQIMADSQKVDQHKTLALQGEQKTVNLENEKMKFEKLHRDKELANQTMDLIRKNKFLVKITDELDKVNRSSSDQSINNKISILIQKINKEIDNEKQWEVFETAFDDVHEDFLKRLKQKYPTLTPKELKLCAYLRLNISTKEIAPLMNISIRGVEICRYRVRKKLNIDRDQNLTSMIIDL